MQAPERFETSRLRLRRPAASDAENIFQRYACDREVTRYLAWPTHTTIEQTHSFLAFSESQWQRSFFGPYLVELRESGTLLGSTGIEIKSKERAETGYALARDAWGLGYATEVLGAVVAICKQLDLRFVSTYCHHEHRASQRVLEKHAFLQIESLNGLHEFPNLETPGPQLALGYRRRL